MLSRIAPAVYILGGTHESAASSFTTRVPSTSRVYIVDDETPPRCEFRIFHHARAEYHPCVYRGPHLDGDEVGLRRGGEGPGHERLAAPGRAVE